MAGSDDIWVCLSGGNALGAFQAGALDALIGLGLDVRAVSGASIGALNGAIIAGNPPEQRLGKLREFWAEASQPTFFGGVEGAKNSPGAEDRPYRAAWLVPSASSGQQLVWNGQGFHSR